MGARSGGATAHSRAGAGGRLPGRAAAWVILVVSGVCEAVWAHALDAGLGTPAAVIAFVAAMAVSMGGLQLALRGIPLGTAYAVWAGTGTASTAAWSLVTGTPFTPAKLAFLALILIGIVGLELTTPGYQAPRTYCGG